MECERDSIDRLASATNFSDSFISASASAAFSALRFVIQDISSSEEEDSSIEDACTTDPSARDELEDDMLDDASNTASPPLISPLITLLRGCAIVSAIYDPNTRIRTRAVATTIMETTKNFVIVTGNLVYRIRHGIQAVIGHSGLCLQSLVQSCIRFGRLLRNLFFLGKQCGKFIFDGFNLLGTSFLFIHKAIHIQCDDEPADIKAIVILQFPVCQKILMSLYFFKRTLYGQIRRVR